MEKLKSIVKEFETKQAAFEEPWCELEAIAHCESLEDFEGYLKNLETPTPVRDGTRRPRRVLIPEKVRRAIVEVLQEKVKKKDFQRAGRDDLRYLVQNVGEWYKTWEGTKPRVPAETGTCNFLLDEVEGMPRISTNPMRGVVAMPWMTWISTLCQSALLGAGARDADPLRSPHPSIPLEQWPGHTYSVVVEDLDVINLQESEMERVAGQINQLCEDLGIPGRVYLVPGSLWIIFCLNIELSRDCRRKFAASLKSWIDQQKQSGANGWNLAQDPCWKPLHAVPDRILELVRQVETLCGSCLPTKPVWLRASDLRNLVARQLNAETMRERKLEEWRVVVFEGLVERRGDSWLQGTGTGTLGCYLLEHFEDERLDHRMQEIANLACKRKQSMRPEVQALVFLLKRAQLELTDEEWTQVVDSARVCYEHLKTVLSKLMLHKDTDLIAMNDDIVDDPEWEFVDSGHVKDSENPSGSNGRDAAAAATAANSSSWNSGLNHIADQQVWSPSSRQAFLSSEGLMASFHRISNSSDLVVCSIWCLNNFDWFSWLPCTKFVSRC